mgnify:FL=1
MSARVSFLFDAVGTCLWQSRAEGITGSSLCAVTKYTATLPTLSRTTSIGRISMRCVARMLIDRSARLENKIKARH